MIGEDETLITQLADGGKEAHQELRVVEIRRDIAELAVEKQANTLLMPVSARRALNDLPDEMWTKIKIEFYGEPADAVFKALEH